MHDRESKSLAALVSLEGVGQRTVATLQNELKNQKVSWEEFWCAPASLMKKMSISEKLIDIIQKFLKEHTIDSYFESLQNRSIRVVTEVDEEYPPLLKTIEHPPAILFMRGQCIDWSSQQHSVAVVGTRHMTGYGKLVTEKITKELVQHEVAVVSGAMYGVDICAHSAAIRAGGKTVAVLGYGFDFVYPRSQAHTIRELEEQGMTSITPFAPQVRPAKGNFPARNALVAGMSDAVVVTEAAEKSGTHITAGFAADYGRTVCAVPGPITSPYSAGTTWLVNQGAVLVSSGSEVVSEITGNFVKGSIDSIETLSSQLTAQQQKVLKCIQQLGCASAEDISQYLQVSFDELLQNLTVLELLNVVTKNGTAWSARRIPF